MIDHKRAAQKETGAPRKSARSRTTSDSLDVNAVDERLQDIALPVGYEWMPQRCLDTIRAIVNHAIVHGRPDWLRIEVEMHDDLPNDNCCALIITHGAVSYRLFVDGWKPVLRDDAQSLLRMIDHIFQSTLPISEFIDDLETTSGAREIFARRKREARELRTAERECDSLTLDLHERISDPSRWATIIPETADLHCVIPANWLNGGAA